jgi:hypothetical protein
MEKKFLESERLLDRLKEKTEKNEWTRGYLLALSGILLAQKSKKDRYLFLRNIDLEQKDELKRNLNEFSEYSENKFHTDYDRGFFSAWTDYLRLSSKI